MIAKGSTFSLCREPHGFLFCDLEPGHPGEHRFQGMDVETGISLIRYAEHVIKVYESAEEDAAALMKGISRPSMADSEELAAVIAATAAHYRDIVGGEAMYRAAKALLDERSRELLLLKST